MSGKFDVKTEVLGRYKSLIGTPRFHKHASYDGELETELTAYNSMYRCVVLECIRDRKEPMLTGETVAMLVQLESEGLAIGVSKYLDKI
jgi:hypothetical protein